MSTRSLICKELPDGQYYGVYCHSDGYLTYNGAMLLDHYSEREKVDELLSFGDMSRLNVKIHPDPTRPHSFDYDNQQEDVCVFYGRDRGEKDIDARIITLESAIDSWCEYMYIFGKDGVWRYYDLTLGEETSLCNVQEDLDEMYEKMGIFRPKDGYGYWSREAVIQEKSRQDSVDGYDEELFPQDNLIKKVRNEVDTFKKSVLSLAPIEIYNLASKIHFYEYIGDYIPFNEYENRDIKVMCNSENLIESLWDKMLELDDFNIGNCGDADFLVNMYVTDCKTQAENCEGLC